MMTDLGTYINGTYIQVNGQPKFSSSYWRRRPAVALQQKGSTMQPIQICCTYKYNCVYLIFSPNLWLCDFCGILENRIQNSTLLFILCLQYGFLFIHCPVFVVQYVDFSGSWCTHCSAGAASTMWLYRRRRRLYWPALATPSTRSIVDHHNNYITFIVNYIAFDCKTIFRLWVFVCSQFPVLHFSV